MQVQALASALKDNIRQVIKGKDDIIDKVTICVLCGAHVLLDVFDRLFARKRGERPRELDPAAEGLVSVHALREIRGAGEDEEENNRRKRKQDRSGH